MEGIGREVASGIHRIEAPLGDRYVACYLVVGEDAVREQGPALEHEGPLPVDLLEHRPAGHVDAAVGRSLETICSGLCRFFNTESFPA